MRSREKCWKNIGRNKRETEQLLRLSHQDKQKFEEFTPDFKFKDSYMKKSAVKKALKLDNDENNEDIEDGKGEDEVNVTDENSRKEVEQE